MNNTKIYMVYAGFNFEGSDNILCTLDRKLAIKTNKNINSPNGLNNYDYHGIEVWENGKKKYIQVFPKK